MSDERFLEILSLQMVTTKMTMQVLAKLLDKSEFNEWKEAYDIVEKKFLEISESIELSLQQR